MADKHPPHISVQHFSKEQKDAGVVPGVPKQSEQPTSVIVEQAQPGAPPTPGGPVAGVPVPADVSESSPPSPVNVPETETGTTGDINIQNQEVIIRGSAAIQLADMLGLEEVWDGRTGEPIPLAFAKTAPDWAVIDFNALRESLADYDPEEIQALMSQIPDRQLRQDVKAQEQKAFAGPPAGPGVTVRQIPGLVRVEVEGPVRLQKARAGNVRIMQVQYSTVQAPTGIGQAKRTQVQPTARGVKQPVHSVVQKPNVKPARTVPRVVREPLPQPQPEPAPTSEDFVDEDYEF